MMTDSIMIDTVVAWISILTCIYCLGWVRTLRRGAIRHNPAVAFLMTNVLGYESTENGVYTYVWPKGRESDRPMYLSESSDGNIPWFLLVAVPVASIVFLWMLSKSQFALDFREALSASEIMMFGWIVTCAVSFVWKYIWSYIDDSPVSNRTPIIEWLMIKLGYRVEGDPDDRWPYRWFDRKKPFYVTSDWSGGDQAFIIPLVVLALIPPLVWVFVNNVWVFCVFLLASVTIELARLSRRRTKTCVLNHSDDVLCTKGETNEEIDRGTSL